MKSLLLISTIFLSACLSSCKKIESSLVSKICPKTVAGIAGNYTIEKVELSGIDGIFKDITNTLDPCALDDELILDANGTTLYRDLGTSCNPNGDSMGTWSISPDGKMTISNAGSSGNISTADITSFDCIKLVLTGTAASPINTKYRLTMKQ